MFLLKNCSQVAKENVKQLSDLYLETSQGGDHEFIKVKTNHIKDLVFKLKNSCDFDTFAEEFINFEGLKALVDIIHITSGNTRVIINIIILFIVICFECFENSSSISQLDGIH